jgi:transcriptional regulator with XRE-family HTH domain
VSIAKRVRECRYAKGWGPDELASRAEISRTALYQIECGKTETPRASTLRRIAQALGVSIEVLLATDESRSVASTQSRDFDRAEGAAVTFQREGQAAEPEPVESKATGGRAPAPRRTLSREGELQRKFRELLSSPLGEGMARIVEETHRLLPRYDE